VKQLEGWFKKIGAPVRLSDVDIPEKDIPEITENVYKLAELWQMKDYTPEVIAGILKYAV